LNKSVSLYIVGASTLLEECHFISTLQSLLFHFKALSACDLLLKAWWCTTRRAHTLPTLRRTRLNATCSSYILNCVSVGMTKRNL